MTPILQRPALQRLAAAAVLTLAGCQGVVLAARTSASPVLLGPVKTLPGPAPKETRPAPTADAAEVRLFSEYTFYYHADFDRPALAHVDSSSLTESAASETDWEVVLATNDDHRRRVELTSVSCGGWTNYCIFMLWERAFCDVDGLVKAPPATARAQPVKARPR